jgi:hypothetical protein
MPNIMATRSHTRTRILPQIFRREIAVARLVSRVLCRVAARQVTKRVLVQRSARSAPSAFFVTPPSVIESATPILNSCL